VALKFANILLISSTSCFTIIFTGILSPIVLGERFRFMVDGVTIILVATGSITAAAQQPSNEFKPTSENINGLVIERLT
jgi:hypothetical protein